MNIYLYNVSLGLCNYTRVFFFFLDFENRYKEEVRSRRCQRGRRGWLCTANPEQQRRSRTSHGRNRKKRSLEQSHTWYGCGCIRILQGRQIRSFLQSSRVERYVYVYVNAFKNQVLTTRTDLYSPQSEPALTFTLLDQNPH